MIPKLTQYIFQTKTFYSRMREREILLPDTKKKLKVRSVHPWTEYTTTSKTLDLAIIVLSKGFQLSKLLKNRIKDKIFLDGVKDPPHSMPIDRKVASSRPVYYSILETFAQRSQYIRIKFPLHSENALNCK